MKRILTAFLLSLSTLILPAFAAGDPEGRTPLVPPLAENEAVSVRLAPNFTFGNATDPYMEYEIYAVADGTLLQTIPVSQPREVLEVVSYQELLDDPQRFVTLEDLDGDGTDDLKVLTGNGGGQGELVYTTYLWDEDQDLFVIGAGATQMPSKPLGPVPPMAENGTYYVRLVKWDGPNVGVGSFTYDICSVADDEVLQTITIERDVKVLRVENQQDILLHPETYISFEDLDRDGVDDLKILSENGGGQGELVYTTYLWDEDQGLFVEGVPEEGSAPWLWIGGAAVVAVGGLLVWRKRKGKETA